MKGKAQSGAIGQRTRAADRLDVAQRGVVAGEDEVVAVVDPRADLRIVIGAAAPARLPRRLVEDDAGPGFGREMGGRQPGETRPDHMHRSAHQRKP